MLNVLFIEADNQRNLGGSCMRDIKNLNEFLTRSGYDLSKRRQTLFLSIDNNKMNNCENDYLKNYRTRFQSFVSNIKDNDKTFICISGHGYQKYSQKSEEKDSMDEYISFGEGLITDNLLYDMLINKLKDKCNRIVCLADTCHSGTMFDLDEKKSNKRNVFSISACLDNQLDSCDISNVGFGGSLTVHLLDIPNSLKILLEDDENSIKNIVKSLEEKLALLNQKPVFSIH